MPDINGIPYVDSSDLVSAYPATSLALAQEVSDQLASKLTYPAGGNDGDLLAKDGTDAEWIAVPEAGLTLITAESFSAVSSVSLNGCFSADYQNYRLIIYISSGTSASVTLRLRASGSDNTTSNYAWNRGFITNGTFTSAGHNDNDTSFEFMFNGNTFTSVTTADIFGPNKAEPTLLISEGYYRQSEPLLQRRFGGSIFKSTNVFDGLTLFLASGTFTGTVRIYGYKD